MRKHKAGSIDESKFGWGLHAAVTAVVFGRDVISVAVHGGDGIGRYMLALPVAGTAFRYDTATGQFDLVAQMGWQVNYGHRWTDKLTSWIYWSQVRWLDKTRIGEDVWDKAAVNLWWTPVGGVKFGIEGIYGRRETVPSVFNAFGPGFANTQFRVQGAGMFFF